MTKNMKVLVVDDNKEGRLLLSKILTSSNYEVIEACNGIDALESLKSSKPDLIISDILMPEMDGFTLLRELNKDISYGKIPVVLYSAQYVNEKDKELAEKLGASGFITKPAEPKDILTKIKTVLAEFGSEETKNVKSHFSKDEEYLGEYAERVFRKLEDKVKELEQEITERKIAEESLKLSEEKYRDLFENANDAICIVGADFKFKDINTKTLQLTGFSKEELIRMSVFDLIPPEQAPRSREELKKLLEKGHYEKFIGKIVTKSGNLIDVEVNSSAIIEDGRIIGSRDILRDITERKRAEEEIRRRSEDFASLFNISKILAAAPDLKTVLQKTVNSITELTVLKSAAIYLLEGESLYLSATTPPLDPQMPDSFRRAKLSDHPHIRESMSTCKPVLLPDTVQADLTLAERDIIEALGLRTVLYLPLIVEGNAVGTLVVAAIREPRDISNAEIDMCYTLANLAALNIQKSQLYESIQHYAADLQCQVAERKHAEEKIAASLKEKEILLREIHHRVKNNMQIISSLLGLESETIKDKKYVDMFRESQNRINSMSLIHEKLYRSRDLAKIELNEYIKDLANVIFQSRGVKTGTIVLNLNIGNVSLGIDHSIPLGLIINELITNSLKYAFPGDRKGEINVSLHVIDENTFELIVGDNGVGIPFDVDFRKTESLGLRLVTILVENQLKGKIDLDRSKGTEFNIKFKGR